MALVTSNQVLDGVAASLKFASSTSLPTYWTALAGEAVTHARQEIYGRLLRRGFTTAEIDAWDRLQEASRDQALWYALTRGGALDGYNKEAVAALDRRKDLDTVLVFIDGVWVKPTSASQPGLVVSAGPSSTGGIFNFPGENEPGLGEDLRW